MSKILVIDDDDDLRSLLEIFFTSTGHQVYSCANGALGLMVAAREMPDVVLLDIDMPVLSGHDTLETLKADIATNHIPVVVLTSYDHTAHRKRAFLTGAGAFISKPVELPDLMTCIDHLIHLRPHA